MAGYYFRLFLACHHLLRRVTRTSVTWSQSSVIRDVVVEALSQIAGDVEFAASVLPGDAATQQAAYKAFIPAIRELWLVSDRLDAN